MRYPSPRTMAAAQAAEIAAPVVAAAARAIHLPAATPRDISPRLSRPPNGTSGAFRWRPRRRSLSRAARRGARGRGLVVVAEFGGTYEDGFEDVHKNIINYFTYKATHTVLHQLYEMNPPSYSWLYNYVAVNDPLDGDYFLRLLAKDRQDLAERVMITRLHLYGKWIKVVTQRTNSFIAESGTDIRWQKQGELAFLLKPVSEQKCDHAMMYERISKENLEIMRQRLLETVVWPTDDTSYGESKD